MREAGWRSPDELLDDDPGGSSPTEGDPSGFDRSRYSRSRSRAGTPRPLTLSGTTGEAASVILGLLLWGWVIRPYLHGGTAEIKQVLRAKFLNQAPDGSQLP